jgi:hypothetical protein
MDVETALNLGTPRIMQQYLTLTCTCLMTIRTIRKFLLLSFELFALFVLAQYGYTIWDYAGKAR